jgi:RsiW-degrading membrane proteinase PrsW (M82 family)
VVGVLSYAFLVAAILKARALSPNRAQNFATRISSEK